MQAEFYYNGKRVPKNRIATLAYGGVLNTPWTSVDALLLERMERKNGLCPDCKGNRWVFASRETRKQGGKPYIYCANCNYSSHL